MESFDLAPKTGACTCWAHIPCHIREPATLREICLPSSPSETHAQPPARPCTNGEIPPDSRELMLCLRGLSAFQILELLQNFRAAAPQGSMNQVPHAAPGYGATSQRTILHMLLQLQTFFREKALGRRVFHKQYR